MLTSFAPIGSVVNDWQLPDYRARSEISDNVKPQQKMRECELKRYGAYFNGWCQVFGEHESISVGDGENCWLIGDKKVGLILPKPLLKELFREVLLHDQIPEITFSQQGVQIGALCFPLRSGPEKIVLDAIGQLIDSGSDLHLFLTCHLLYANGNRIVTISNRKPQSIVYKQLGSMKIRLE